MPTPGAAYDGVAGKDAIDAWKAAYERHAQLILQSVNVPFDRLGAHADAIEAAEREMNVCAAEMEKYRIRP